MNKTVVVYKSKYGKTKRYAEWIAEALNAPLFENGNITPLQLNNYDIVVYGGGLYGGEINGVKLVTKNFCKLLVVFTVGLADPGNTDFKPILENTFTGEQLSKTKVFHLRGGIDYSKLSLVHKGIMAVMKKMIEKKPSAERDGDSAGILETYGKNIDFSDKETIKPLTEYVRTLYLV